MDKETLSHYGWIVILILVLSVMLAFATPFGQYVGTSVKQIAENFGITSSNNLSDENIDKLGDDFDNKFNDRVKATCGIEGHYEGDGKNHVKLSTPCNNGHEWQCQCNGWVVPAGGTYTTSQYINGKRTYNSGEQLPCGYIAQKGDTYEDEEYEYSINSTWRINTVKDRHKTSYGEMLSNIAGVDVTRMYFTFHSCKDMEYAPKIPNTITDMYSAFLNCDKLITAPEIPYGVTQMFQAFSGCSSLTTGPKLPDTVKNMDSTFSYCYSLKTSPQIPYGVTNMHQTFLKCNNLLTAPEIPNSVTVMKNTFMYCDNLQSVSTIPSSVTDMFQTFRDCENLTGDIKINANPTSFDNCFMDTKKNISLTGTSSVLQQLASTATNGNVTVANANIVTIKIIDAVRKKGISNAEVTIKNENCQFSGTTNSDGTVEFNNVPDGSYQVFLSCATYEFITDVTVNVSGKTEATFSAERTASVIP